MCPDTFILIIVKVKETSDLPFRFDVLARHKTDFIAKHSSPQHFVTHVEIF